MSFFRTAPKKVITAKEFRKRFQEQVLIVCDMRTQPGRPRQSVLGSTRTQMTRAVAAQIGTAMVDDLDLAGEVFDPPSQFLYELHGRSKWCADEVAKMATIKNKLADHPDPFVKLMMMLGSLIPLNTRKTPGERKETVRIATVSGTDADFFALASRLSDAGRKAASDNNAAARHIRHVADLMRKMGGPSLEEAMALHSDGIRRGE